MKARKSKDKKGVYYVLLLVLMGLIVSGFFLYRYQEENHKLELHKRLLIDRLADAVTEYKYLKTENDSLKQVIEEDRQNILNLMDSVSGISLDSKDKLQTFEESFSAMRKDLLSLRLKVDSLQNQNDSLVMANHGLKSQSTTLADTNKKLQEILNENTFPKIRSLHVDAINRKWNGNQEITTDNFWTDFLRVCYGIESNKLADTGLKIIGIRVLKPDSSVITGGETFSDMERDSGIVYSYMQSVEYNGNALAKCVDIADENFQKGQYYIEIYYHKRLQAVTSLLLD